MSATRGTRTQNTHIIVPKEFPGVHYVNQNLPSTMSISTLIMNTGILGQGAEGLPGGPFAEPAAECEAIAALVAAVTSCSTISGRKEGERRLIVVDAREASKVS